jgi:hypothetical protein
MYFSALPLILLLFTKSSSCIPTATQAFSAVPISKQIASLSIEFCYIVDYLGDISGSNVLSKQLLQNIQDISGVPPLIRIGGHTQDAAQYCSDCSETLVNVFAPGNLEAVNVTYNKNLFSILNNHVPSKQKFIFGLNLGRDVEIFPQQEVAAAEQYLHDSRVQSYELGNEPDFFGASQTGGPWNVQIYTSRVVSWIKQIQANTKTKRGWQFGALAQEAKWQGNFSIPEFNALGVPESIKPLVAYSDHTYPYSICSCMFFLPPCTLRDIANSGLSSGNCSPCFSSGIDEPHYNGELLHSMDSFYSSRTLSWHPVLHGRDGICILPRQKGCQQHYRGCTLGAGLRAKWSNDWHGRCFLPHGHAVLL